MNVILCVYQTNANEGKWKEDRDFMNSKIVKSFQSYANMGKQPTHGEWKDLLVLVEKSIPEFWKAMSSFTSMMVDVEFKVCLLTRLSFTPSQIANLLGVSKQSVTNKRKKLVQILLKQEPFSTQLKRLNLRYQEHPFQNLLNYMLTDKPFG